MSHTIIIFAFTSSHDALVFFPYSERLINEVVIEIVNSSASLESISIVLDSQPANIAISGNMSTIIVLNGTSSPEEYTMALQHLRYQLIGSEPPCPLNRTLEITVTSEE